jgi:hypothetical protein
MAEELAKNPHSLGILICGTGIGISITENLARMWGPHNEMDLFENLAGEITPIAVVESNQVAVISGGLTPGSTIAAETSTAVLVAPTF